MDGGKVADGVFLGASVLCNGLVGVRVWELNWWMGYLLVCSIVTKMEWMTIYNSRHSILRYVTGSRQLTNMCAVEMRSQRLRFVDTSDSSTSTMPCAASIPLA